MDKIDGVAREKQWSEDEDSRLLDCFKIYSYDMDTCISKLA